jgi:hypothetical protein
LSLFIDVFFFPDQRHFTALHSFDQGINWQQPDNRAYLMSFYHIPAGHDWKIPHLVDLAGASHHRH